MFLDFYKSLKVKLIEHSKNRKEGLSKVAKDAAFIFGTLAVFGGIANFAVSSGKKKEIQERANGFCEGCGEKLSLENATVGHLDHKQSDRYQINNNLKLHCPACEAGWHASHLNRAKEIGLSEADNYTATISRLLSLVKWSGEKFVELCSEYSDLIGYSFARVYLRESELVIAAFEDQQIDFPVNLIEVFKEMANDSDIVFVSLYLRNKDVFDRLFEENEEELPISVAESLGDLASNSKKDFMSFYLNHKKEIDNCFQQVAEELPIDPKQFLIQLSVDDPEYFSKLFVKFPIEFKKILGDMDSILREITLNSLS